MTLYYHATLSNNIRPIEILGLRPGYSGMFGGSIYFADNPENAMNKCRLYNPNAIIIAKIDVDRLMTENARVNIIFISMQN